MVTINKIDLIPEAERAPRIAAFLRGYGTVERHFAVSAIDGAGCRELAFAVMEYLERQRQRVADPATGSVEPDATPGARDDLGACPPLSRQGGGG